MKTILLTLTLLIFFSSTAQEHSRGINLYEQDQLEEAKRYFESKRKSNSSDPEVFYYLGRIAFDQEQYEEAESYFEEAIELDDRKADYYTWLGNSMGSYVNDVNVLKKGMLAKRIKKAYETSVELDPKNIDGYKGLIEFYTGAPGFMGGSWEKAEEMARIIKSLDVLQGHASLILVFRRMEAYDKVEQEYIAASKIDKSWLLRLGLFYQGRNEFDKAFSTFEEAYSSDSENLNALYQIGRTSALSGEKVELGIKSLNQYLSLAWKEGTPSHAGALMRLGMIYEKSGDTQEAISNYKKSLNLDPELKQSKEGLERLK